MSSYLGLGLILSDKQNIIIVHVKNIENFTCDNERKEYEAKVKMKTNQRDPFLNHKHFLFIISAYISCLSKKLILEYKREAITIIQIAPSARPQIAHILDIVLSTRIVIELTHIFNCFDHFFIRIDIISGNISSRKLLKELNS